METLDDGHDYRDTSLSRHQYNCEEACCSFLVPMWLELILEITCLELIAAW